ncbi:MAG: hypothetical protein ACLFVR_12485 [Thiohalospira sp.]
MKPCTINLNQMADKGRRYKRLVFILALIFLVSSAIVSWLLYRKDNPNEWFFVGLFFYFLLFIYFGIVGYKAKMYIHCDDFALEYQFGFLKKVPEKIIWETLDKIKLGFTSITFFKKSGRKKVLKIGWVPYEKLKQVKNTVQEICTEKGIAIEVAEYKQQE